MRNPFRRRSQPEARAITSVPWEAGGNASSARMVTQDRALKLAPVYAAVRHLSDGIGTLPLKGYRQLGDTRRPMPELPPRLQCLADQGTLIDWCTQAVGSMACQGAAIGLILTRDEDGYPTTVRWRPRGEFFVDDLAPGGPQWYWMGRRVARSEIVYIPWLTLPGRTMALSPIEAFAMTVNAGLSAQEYSNDWFAAGGVPPGTFKNAEQEIDQDQAQVIKKRLVAAIKTREPIVYGKDWDFTPITVSPGDAQFVESQNLSANQIAAIYGIEPEEVGGQAANSLTYSNEEMRQTTRLSNWRPWMARFEAGITAVLPPMQYVRFNAAATVRADVKTRWEVYRVQRELGVVTLNEIRAWEDLPPIPGPEGDQYVSEDVKKRDVAETIQKVYLGVGKVITSDEARQIANSAGAGLAVPGPAFPAAGVLPDQLRGYDLSDTHWTYPG